MQKEKLLAIHIWQPWADLICCGAKTIETRTWPIKYRGPVLICGTQALNKHSRAAIDFYKSDAWEDGLLLPSNYKPRLGVAVATANLVASRKLSWRDRRAAAYADHWSLEYEDKNGDWHTKIGWVLEDIVAITPFKMKGRQRPFFVDVDVKLIEPSLMFDLPTHQPATTEPEKRQIKLF